MAAKFNQQGQTIKATAAATVSSGTMVSLGANLMGVAVNDAAIGQPVAYRIAGVFTIDTNTIIHSSMAVGNQLGIDFGAQEVIAFPGTGNPSVIVTEILGDEKGNYLINQVAT